MKVMKKEKIFDLEIESQIANEIEIMIILNHKNIIKMTYYFETKDELILILEYAKQGTLFRKIKEREKQLYSKNKTKKTIHLNDNMIIKVRH
jgi:aurora kinase